MDLRQTYNKIAVDWYNDHNSDIWWVEGTDKFLSLLKPGSKVLDVGCGAGAKSAYLLDHGMDVTGIDFSEEMIRLAKEHEARGHFFVWDMNNLDKFDQVFEGIFAQASLLHIQKKDVQNVLEAFKAKLVSRGYLYLAVKEIRSGNVQEEIVKENDYGYEYERFFSYYSLDEIRSYFHELGMTIVYESKSGKNNTIWLQVIAQKNE
jgi:SAM-dependent methyltransferase